MLYWSRHCSFFYAGTYILQKRMVVFSHFSPDMLDKFPKYLWLFLETSYVSHLRPAAYHGQMVGVVQLGSIVNCWNLYQQEMFLGESTVLVPIAPITNYHKLNGLKQIVL